MCDKSSPAIRSILDSVKLHKIGSRNLSVMKTKRLGPGGMVSICVGVKGASDSRLMKRSRKQFLLGSGTLLPQIVCIETQEMKTDKKRRK